MSAHERMTNEFYPHVVAAMPNATRDQARELAGVFATLSLKFQEEILDRLAMTIPALIMAIDLADDTEEQRGARRALLASVERMVGPEPVQVISTKEHAIRLSALAKTEANAAAARMDILTVPPGFGHSFSCTCDECVPAYYDRTKFVEGGDDK